MQDIERAIAWAAHAHTLCIAILVAFHAFLISGKPWGHLTMAGKYPGELPKRMKVFSGISILILLTVNLIVEVAAGNILPQFQGAGQRAVLGVVVFNVIQVVLHVITPSTWERIAWLPVISVMLLCSTAVWWLT